jgi:thioredoxin reductase (NADPH)
MFARHEALRGAQASIWRTHDEGMFVVPKGALTMTARVGLGRMAQVARHGPGQLTDEVVQLSTRAAVVDADADDDLEALVIPTDRLHA